MLLLLYCTKLFDFFREFRENGFEKSLVDARELAEELEMSPDEMIFANSSAHRKRLREQFDYEAQDESSNLNATEKFRAEFFFIVMDNAVAVSDDSVSDEATSPADVTD